MVITVDGAAGVGKSTVARTVANKLGFYYVSTGQIYRSLAYAIMSGNNERFGTLDIISYINVLSLDFKDDVLIANGIDDEEVLQNEEIATFAARVGTNMNYKKAISEKIVLAVGERNVVVEGRMAGVLLFPNADLKVYLYADIKKRIERKMKQMPEYTYERVKDSLEKRDTLVNTIVGMNTHDINTSNKSLQMVVNEIVNVFKTITP